MSTQPLVRFLDGIFSDPRVEFEQSPDSYVEFDGPCFLMWPYRISSSGLGDITSMTHDAMAMAVTMSTQFHAYLVVTRSDVLHVMHYRIWWCGHWGTLVVSRKVEDRESYDHRPPRGGRR